MLWARRKTCIYLVSVEYPYFPWLHVAREQRVLPTRFPWFHLCIYTPPQNPMPIYDQVLSPDFYSQVSKSKTGYTNSSPHLLQVLGGCWWVLHQFEADDRPHSPILLVRYVWQKLFDWIGVWGWKHSRILDPQARSLKSHWNLNFKSTALIRTLASK